ncbi:hypothetical protein DPMN_187263 [Dreissena polymorpha]|uniref:Uncharacterized protein n=1 Tax=Dreissena polymorpha TaxID=45954 RepID=A0A9D4DN06_DREPO|nr:hypothetical protein DPMN_187263 [Dreissena polymorpha]
MPMRSPGECRWRPGRAPVYRCTVAIPELCRQSPGHHRRHPMRCRSSTGVCMGPGGTTVPSRLFPVPRRSLPVLPGGIKHCNTFPEPRSSPPASY